MAQLHFYVPDEVEKEIRRKAAEAKLPLSRYLAELVKREAHISQSWPEGYFEDVFGTWAGELKRPPQGHLEDREPFE
jgi:hypothetical protein